MAKKVGKNWYIYEADDGTRYSVVVNNLLANAATFSLGKNGDSFFSHQCFEIRDKPYPALPARYQMRSLIAHPYPQLAGKKIIYREFPIGNPKAAINMLYEASVLGFQGVKRPEIEFWCASRLKGEQVPIRPRFDEFYT
jgi:hypothetical protein